MRAKKKAWAWIAALALGTFAQTETAGTFTQTETGGANTFDASALGAALVAPYVTGDAAELAGEGRDNQITVVTITNTLDMALSLHVVVISETWATVDMNCELTGHESTYLVFEADPVDGPAPSENSKVTLECSESGGTDVRVQSVHGRRGIAFVAIECREGEPGCPSGLSAPRTLPDNALLGDATILDFDSGYAVSMSAVHIQSAGKPALFDGDQLYEFDGNEYKNFPSMLTTNYIAPDDSVTLELLLFTLDGKINDRAIDPWYVSGIQVRVGVMAFDDDENMMADSILFDCFFLGDLTDQMGFGQFITRSAGGHLAGHIKLTPGISQSLDSNEVDFPNQIGDANSFRRRPIHGWILQSIADGGLFAGGEYPSTGPHTMMTGQAAWGRLLVQNTHPLQPLGRDRAALNAIPPPVPACAPFCGVIH